MQHILLFVGTKLMLLCSQAGAPELRNNDLLLLTLLAQGPFKGGHVKQGERDA